MKNKRKSNIEIKDEILKSWIDEEILENEELKLNEIM